MKKILKWIENIHPIKIYSILCVISAIILFFITDGINQYKHSEYIIGILISSISIPIGIIGLFIFISSIIPIFSIRNFRKITKYKKYNKNLETTFLKFSDEELEDMDMKCTFTSIPPCFPEYQQIQITRSMITSEIKRRKSERTKQFLINNIPVWIIIAIIFFCLGHFYK